MRDSLQDTPFIHQLLYQNEVSTPLGRLGIAGIQQNGRGVTSARTLRVYGSYAVMCVLRGAGRYRDIHRQNRDIQAGDAVLVFPELAHRYGPRRHQPAWDEFYITFDGPLFDHWRESGLLDASQPVLHPGIAVIYDWSAQVRRLLQRRTATVKERARQVADFATLLGDLLQTSESQSQIEEAFAPLVPDAWVGHAQQILQTDLGRDLPLTEVAAAVNQSYETFRKGFRESVGTTPAHYRAVRRIEAARALLQYTPGITNREIAETLGFADEFHFSRRFTQIARITPRAFRQSLGENTQERNGD